MKIRDSSTDFHITGIVHEEVYKDYSAEDINDIYSEKEALPLTAELLKENNVDNLAKVFTQFRYKKKTMCFSQINCSLSWRSRDL